MYWEMHKTTEEKTVAAERLEEALLSSGTEHITRGQHIEEQHILTMLWINGKVQLRRRKFF